eukprot:GFYU01013207.1.p1 GENE.GFYU01013207.1~~GFYU01013207.1.p1  ORF type:complete len:309 (-),score=44.62 GFYU01013207.1:237-1163(-)
MGQVVSHKKTLAEAVRAGDLKRVQDLLTSKPKLLQQDLLDTLKDGVFERHPYVLALKCGHVPIAKDMISRGLYVATEPWQNMLHYLVMSRNHEFSFPGMQVYQFCCTRYNVDELSWAPPTTIHGATPATFFLRTAEITPTIPGKTVFDVLKALHEHKADFSLRDQYQGLNVFECLLRLVINRTVTQIETDFRSDGGIWHPTLDESLLQAVKWMFEIGQAQANAYDFTLLTKARKLSRPEEWQALGSQHSVTDPTYYRLALYLRCDPLAEVLKANGADATMGPHPEVKYDSIIKKQAWKAKCHDLEIWK